MILSAAAVKKLLDDPSRNPRTVLGMLLASHEHMRAVLENLEKRGTAVTTAYPREMMAQAAGPVSDAMRALRASLQVCAEEKRRTG